MEAGDAASVFFDKNVQRLGAVGGSTAVTSPGCIPDQTRLLKSDMHLGQRRMESQSALFLKRELGLCPNTADELSGKLGPSRWPRLMGKGASRFLGPNLGFGDCTASPWQRRECLSIGSWKRGESWGMRRPGCLALSSQLR